MRRMDLRVPISEKDAAKRLGARWDPRQRIWYVPEGVDALPLQQWLPAPQAPNIRAPCYFLATTTRDCWRCRAVTRVVGIALPAGHEVFYVADDPADDEWELAQEPTLLSYVEDLAELNAVRLRRQAPHYHIDFSQTLKGFYWMNHCEHCAAKLGDFDTFCEPGLAFRPMDSNAAATIALEQIAQPFSAWCGSHTCGLEWFADAQQPNSHQR
jgi:hypothetical protein